jgi:hypothetical protein
LGRGTGQSMSDVWATATEVGSIPGSEGAPEQHDPPCSLRILQAFLMPTPEGSRSLLATNWILREEAEKSTTDLIEGLPNAPAPPPHEPPSMLNGSADIDANPPYLAPLR